MIAGLIQQQDMGFAEGDFGKSHPALLSTREGVHWLQRKISTNAKGP